MTAGAGSQGPGAGEHPVPPPPTSVPKPDAAFSRVGLFVIGDEILSGKRQDKHLPKAIELLRARGASLSWAQFLPDDEAAIAAAIGASRARGDVVLSCGGIGATPDDCTRQAAARAFGVPLTRHAEAQRLIERQYGVQAHPHRVLMADFPQGAGLIPNPVNRVAGFFLERHYFVPGFPEMAWPMLEWVLDTECRDLHRSDPPVEYTLRVLGTSGEADLLELMQELLRMFPGVRLSSLPFRGDATRPRHIEFGLRGTRREAARAFAFLRRRLAERPGAQVEDLRAPGAAE
ncbi:MAG: competence/damage-inducible protein A [Gammaproteobacteria bacterium]|nr:competence/damage-inducible protein A [Gammaproteobacteria bacterium]